MTRLEAITRLRNYFENNIYFSTDDFLASLQDGYDEVAAFSGCILKAVNIPYNQYVSYYDMINLIPDFIGTFAIFNSVTHRWMSPVSLKKLDRHRTDWETAYGTPEYFSTVSHRYVAIYRKPGTTGYGDAWVYYIAAAPTLTADSDLIQIPDEFVAVLEDYSIVDLQEQQQEWTKAGNYFANYTASLEDLRSWAKEKRLPARMPNLAG
jgi:hypothetical protein